MKSEVFTPTEIAQLVPLARMAVRETEPADLWDRIASYYEPIAEPEIEARPTRETD